ncbi:MAG: HAD family hydrolase [Nitrososphaera sp.]
MASGRFVFFDLGQTLIDEGDFIAHFDRRLLEVLNGYGARIDERNYLAVRDSIIRNRGIGTGSVPELVEQICKLTLPEGYFAAVMSRVQSEISRGREALFRFFPEAADVLEALSEMRCEMGIIANQADDVSELLRRSGLSRFFKVSAISSQVNLKKPDPRIFLLAMEKAGVAAGSCVMVGDRLDTDICPANRLGMETIRTCESLFSLQAPREECEVPAHTAASLSDVPSVMKGIISGGGNEST